MTARIVGKPRRSSAVLSIGRPSGRAGRAASYTCRMTNWKKFRKAWAAHWRLNPRRTEPLALQLLVTGASGLLVGLLLSLGAGLQGHNLISAVWLHSVMPANTLLGLCVAACFHIAYRLIEA